MAIEQKRFKNTWSIVGTLFCAGLLIKFLGPNIIKSFFANGFFSMLNLLTGAGANQMEGFYLGRMEEVYFGPASIVLFTTALLVYAYTFLVNASAKHFFASIFVYFLVTKFEILLWPPYGDSASGPFIEALWLRDHNFDYIGLSQQPRFLYGGPKVYLFSIYPTFQAILMNLIPASSLFNFVNHILAFGLGALTITLFREVNKKVFDEKIALLLSVLLLSLPLFQSQVEQINMEIPVLAFSMLSMFYLADKKIRLAALYSLAAIMAKGIAIFIGVTVFAAGLILYFFDKEQKYNIKTLLWTGAALLFVIGKFYASVFLLPEDGNIGMVGILEGIRWLKTFIIGYLYVVSLFVFIWFLLKQKSPQKNLSQLISRHYVPLIIFICVAGWILLYSNSFGDQVRYRLTLAPFSLFCIYFSFQVLFHPSKQLAKVLIGLIIVSAVCSYGMIYPAPTYHADSTFERSLEYRNDLKVDLKLANALKNTAPHVLIGAPFTIAQILAIPELGYVDKNLNVMIYGYPCKYRNIKNFNGLDKIDPDKTIWIGVKFNPERFVDFPVGPNDHVIGEISMGYRKAQIFLGGFAIDKRHKEILRALKAPHLIKYHSKPK